MSELQFTVSAEQSGKRIDSWLAEQIEGLTRSAAQNLLSAAQEKLQAGRRRGGYGSTSGVKGS